MKSTFLTLLTLVCVSLCGTAQNHFVSTSGICDIRSAIIKFLVVLQLSHMSQTAHCLV